MEISVTLFGGLRHFLPAGSSFNKCKIGVDEGASLEALLQRVPIPADKPYLVILSTMKKFRERLTPIPWFRPMTT